MSYLKLLICLILFLFILVSITDIYVYEPLQNYGSGIISDDILTRGSVPYSSIWDDSTWNGITSIDNKQSVMNDFMYVNNSTSILSGRHI